MVTISANGTDVKTYKIEDVERYNLNGAITALLCALIEDGFDLVIERDDEFPVPLSRN